MKADIRAGEIVMNKPRGSGNEGLFSGTVTFFYYVPTH